MQCEKNHILQKLVRVFAWITPAFPKAGTIGGGAVMKARFARSAALLCRCRRTSTLGFLLTLMATGSVAAQQGTPEQRRACTPDVYRLCAGEIPDARAITACLRRQKSSLRPACAAVFEQ